MFHSLPWLRGLTLLSILVLAGCAQKKPDSTFEQLQRPLSPQKAIEVQPRIRKVGLLLPLSGEHAELGKSLKNGAELSLFENADDDLKLVIQDTKGTSEGAVLAAQKVLAENVQLILGPVFAFEARSIMPYVRARKVPTITFSSDQNIVGQGIYMLGFSPRAQVKRIVTFAQAQGIHRIAALIPLNPYGLLVESELKALAKSGEINAVTTIFYKGKGENLENDLARLKEQNFDGLLLPVGGEDLKLLLSNLQGFEFDISRLKLLGTGLWDTPDTQAIPALLKGWYACADPLERRAFENQYRQNYGVLPQRISTIAYDAVSLAATLSKNEAVNPYTPDRLTQQQGFIGMDGLFRLAPEGVAERTLAVLEMTPHGPQVLAPADKQFSSQ